MQDRDFHGWYLGYTRLEFSFRVPTVADLKIYFHGTMPTSGRNILFLPMVSNRKYQDYLQGRPLMLDGYMLDRRGETTEFRKAPIADLFRQFEIDNGKDPNIPKVVIVNSGFYATLAFLRENFGWIREVE